MKNTFTYNLNKVFTKTFSTLNIEAPPMLSKKCNFFDL